MSTDALAFFDYLGAKLGVSSRSLQDLATRMRDDPGLMRPLPPGRRKPGTQTFTRAEKINLVLAVCAAPPPGRPRTNVVAAVRALRSAERARDWEEGAAPDKPKANELLRGLSRAADASTFGELIDSAFADMCDGTWRRWEGVFGYMRLRFTNGGERIFATFDRWPTTSPADYQTITLLFRSEWLRALYPPTELDCDIRVDKFLLKDMAAT